MIDYVACHLHSQGSILDGYAKVPEYLDQAKALGLRGLGLSDHGNVTQIYRFLETAKAMDLLAVPGCEFYVAPENPLGAKVKEPVFYGPGGRKQGDSDVAGNGAYLHMTLFAVNNQGLLNLFKLSTLSYEEARVYSKPRIDFELLEQYSEGIVALTGCPSSEVSTRFRLGQDQKAYAYASRLKEVFGDRLFVEIMDHNMSIDLERKLLPKQVELSKKLGIPLLATNDSHYAYKTNAPHHEEMLCMQSGSLMKQATSDNGGTRFAFQGNEYYLKSGEEMAALFPERDFPGALSNSMLIAEMAQDVRIGFDPTLKPRSVLPPGEDEVSYFKKLINKGFKDRYSNEDPAIRTEAKKRIAHEFKVIHSSDFIGYFLTVHEYINWARENYSTVTDEGETLAIPVGPGRGSAGGSVIAYCLYITEICPVRYDLFFERFLSAGRGATYRITYDDGTHEDLIVSEEKIVHREGAEPEMNYIHQLALGDMVEVDEAAVTPVEEPKPMEAALTDFEENDGDEDFDA